MKVAMIGHKVVPSRRGGIENVLTTLCPLLSDLGADITCYNRSSDEVENEYVGTVEEGKYQGVTLKKGVDDQEKRIFRNDSFVYRGNLCGIWKI